MNEDRHSVKVNIFGSEYAIRGDANEIYIQTLAKYVNEKMNDIAQSTHLTSPLKISILAGINLADEVFRLRNQRGEAPPDQDLAELAEEPGPAIAPEAISALSAHIQSALEEE